MSALESFAQGAVSRIVATRDDKIRAAFAGTVVGSVGPVATQSLRDHGIEADVEPSHPKMGPLVRETSQRCHAILAGYRRSGILRLGMAYAAGIRHIRRFFLCLTRRAKLDAGRTLTIDHPFPFFSASQFTAELLESAAFAPSTWLI